MATLIAFFAHPDDEVLHAGGTLARAAAEGHRVVLVSATDGEMGPVREGRLRLRELDASGAALGASRVTTLGYADSGHGRDLYPDPPDRPRFVRVPRQEAAEALAAILREEKADLLLTHDAGGGYGHRDHVHAHEVALHASHLAGGIRTLTTAIPRTAAIRLLRLTSLLRSPRNLRTFRTAMLRIEHTPREQITHAIDARPHAARKQAALAAHASQVWGAGRSAGAFRALVRMRTGLFAALLGREWWSEVRLG
ncbi:GlcNAc-PI de-N-acetylase [Streptomyces spiroverticillatus]|uniref:GlcNAc-PI de-N-acetylase n=1 Tax=Streptomyces finlayi TaxID=67296 RepID=A0A918WUE9_9ACTN|nr:PIG-L family deacetylase [Streptomyces finlayi]GHA00175.1 GlcNAc-PI de-N-acetylase [Streptomyces spiroverticillatus]GHC84678.1 GlcNAc-PI de-N-acetylase [Streptomyces finlayi]